MASVLSYLRELNIITMMLRILLAVLCGGLIGLERERKNRPAGLAGGAVCWTGDQPSRR